MKVYGAITTVSCHASTPTPNITCTFKNRCNQVAFKTANISVIKGMIMF